MARKALVSKPLTKLSSRVLGMQAIDPKLVLPNGLSIDGGTVLANSLQSALDEFNLTQKVLDEKRSEVTRLNKEAEAYSKGIFDTVKSQYGDDAIEYEKVGGTRKSNRAKKGSKTKKAAKATTKTV